MTRLGNLGVVTEGNGGDADPKQKGNVNLHIIVITIPVLAKERFLPYNE